MNNLDIREQKSKTFECWIIEIVTSLNIGQSFFFFLIIKPCYHFSPTHKLWWACLPRTRICCLAMLSFPCNTSFWPSRVNTWSFSSSIVSLASTFCLPAKPECPFLSFDILVENLKEKDTKNNCLALQCMYGLTSVCVRVCVYIWRIGV